MTPIAFPDVSSWQDGLRLQPGTVAALAKATQGTSFRDPNYDDFRSQAREVGALFSAYHFLSSGNGLAQADFCRSVVVDTPVMVDMERTSDIRPTMDDCLQFVIRMWQFGKRVWAVYLPRWYWVELGRPDLSWLQRRGIALVSSDYSGYSDSGSGWDSYGGMTPAVWQYTSAMPYGGKLLDFNAFRGTLSDLTALITGVDDMATAQEIWAYHGNDGAGGGPDHPDVHQSLLTTRDGVAQLLVEQAAEEATLTTVVSLLNRIAAKIGA